MAKKIPTFEQLSSEYAGLWANFEVRPEKRSILEGVARQLFQSRPRYDTVAKATGVPWFVIAIIHKMECNCSWGKHLHNGDSLLARTRQVPAGRPAAGQPPFTWEESAIDALTMKGYHKITDWSVERIAWALENYNGWGYRLYHPEVHSAYLWSYTNLYTSGKYVSDGVWSSSAVSGQAGAMSILRTMLDMDSAAIDIHQPTATEWVKSGPGEDLPTTNTEVAKDIVVTAAKSRTAWSAIGAAISLVVAGIQSATDYVAHVASETIEQLPNIVSTTKESTSAFIDLAQTVGIADNVKIGATSLGLLFALVAFVRHVDLKRKK